MARISNSAMFVFVLCAVAVTVMFIAILTIYDPPSIFGYAFGFLNGALWIAVFYLARDFWED